MLEVVHIRDYALIDALDVEFQPGLNVITGETGAGKSIVVGALGLALGARASADAVRSGADRASVEAVFRVAAPSPPLSQLLADSDISLEDDMLILSRTVAADGRSRAQVNGKLVTIAALAAIGDELVDLHGQHEHQSLLRSACQLALLDAYAGADDAAREVASCVSRLNKLHREIETLEADDRDRARQADFLRYEIAEIDAANLEPGEEEALRERQHLITHAENIYTLANTAYGALYDSDETAAIDAIDAALTALEELEDIDPAFSALRAQATEARAGIEDVAEELRGYTSRMEFDADELDTVNARLAAIGDLKRKYGETIPDILAYCEEAAQRLSGYDNRDARLTALQQEREALLAEADQKAAALSRQRKDGAARMDAQILKTLQSLDMRGARFATSIEEAALCATGIDKVAFMLAANKGEPPKPLRQVASGGEISRIMLALKTVFAAQDPVSTLIFDEIDTGIGGATARRVAEKMQLLGKQRQVLCITHLAQIAAPSRAHYVVMKTTASGRSGTRISLVAGEEREQELARLLDGSVSAVSLKHARALLAEYHEKKSSTRKRKQQ